MQESVLISFSFQSHSGFSNSVSNLAIEKSGKTDVAEALDLSEKLVCTRAISPLPPHAGSPAVSVNCRII
jgi:hypothetical protein